MWNLVILTVMTSFAGFYSLQHEKYLPDEKVVIARNLAESMANYKEAVVSYSSAHEDVSGQIANSEISNHYPTGYSNDKAKTWTNYIDEDGTIYVYPAEQLPTKITNELAKLSHNSAMVGTTGDNGTLEATSNVPNSTSNVIAPKSTVQLPQNVSRRIPHSYPVWMAHRRHRR